MLKEFISGELGEGLMERNRSLDLAKGIAIILVVLGHTYSFSEGNVILNWIHGFHMPFFFIVSGILYGQKTECVNSFRFGLGSKIKTLLVPYFVFEIPFALYLCLAKYLAGGLTGGFAAGKVLAVMNLTGLHSTWFLPCMLFVQILFCACSRAGKLPCIVMAACLAAVGLLCPAPEGYLTVVLRCFVALGFFTAGFFGSRWWQKGQKPVIAALAAVAYCLIADGNGLVSLVNCTFSNPLLYVVNALLGTFVLLQLSIHLCNPGRVTAALEYMGRNSIIILCTHAFIIEAFRLADHKLFHNFLPRLGFFEGPVFTVLILLAEIPVMIIGQRYVPAVFGLRKKERK